MHGEGPVAKLASVVDTQGPEFRANAAAMRALVKTLEDKRAEAALGGSARSRERHVSRGKILPRRISGTCALHQRKLQNAIKRARIAALLPFATD